MRGIRNPKQNPEFNSGETEERVSESGNVNSAEQTPAGLESRVSVTWRGQRHIWFRMRHEWGRGATQLFANAKEAELFISGPASSILSGLLISPAIFPLQREGRKGKAGIHVNRGKGWGGGEASRGFKKQEIARDYRLNVFIENRFASRYFRTYVESGI